MSETQGATAPSAEFDLASLFTDDEATVEVQILNPKTNMPTGAVITVYSRDSERSQKVTRAAQNRRLGRLSKRGNYQLTADETFEEEIDILVACTKGWQMPPLNGKDFPFTTDNVRALYSKAPEIREQVQEAIRNRALFMKG